MKKIIQTFLPIFILSSQVFAIAGFGAQFGQSMFSVEESSPTFSVPGVTLKNGAYDNAYSVGGYFYIDAIPVVDLEVDFNIQGNKYDINFEFVFPPPAIKHLLVLRRLRISFGLSFLWNTIISLPFSSSFMQARVLEPIMSGYPKVCFLKRFKS